jgi:membrane protein required for colicin V production
MTWIDYIIGLLLGWAAFKGFRRGFIMEFLSLLGLILGFWAGLHFSKLAAGLLRDTFHITTEYLPLLSFVFVFLAVLLGVYFLGKMLETSAELLLMGWLNKLLGIVFGALKQALILSFLLMILNHFAPSGDILSKEDQQKSFFYKAIKGIAPLMLPRIKELGKGIDEGLTAEG